MFSERLGDPRSLSRGILNAMVLHLDAGITIVHAITGYVFTTASKLVLRPQHLDAGNPSSRQSHRRHHGIPGPSSQSIHPSPRDGSLAGKTASVKDSSGNTVCSCTLSPFTCSCTFTAPSSPGTYTYYVYVGTSSASSTLSVKYCKYNPYSGKRGCCDSSTDCVDYDGKCVSSGSWGNGNGLPLDYCYNGDWNLGYCVESEESCLNTGGIEYTTDTSGCEIYELGCYPYDRYFVVTAVIECTSDRNCPGYDPNTHLKRYCDTSIYKCKTLASCVDNTECEGGWCCDYITQSYKCVSRGTILSSVGKSYICDPPEGFINFSSENTNIQVSKKLTLLDLLINPFSYFLKK